MRTIAYLHSQKICHRDLQPTNFLFENKEDNCRLKLIDFGISKIFGKDSLKIRENIRKDM